MFLRVCATGQKSPALQAEGAAIVKRKSITQTLCLAVASCVGMAGVFGGASLHRNGAGGQCGQCGRHRHRKLYGSVGYAYNIGKYEVTAGQYTEFLNAVARDRHIRAVQHEHVRHHDVGSGITAQRRVRQLQLRGERRFRQPPGELRVLRGCDAVCQLAAQRAADGRAEPQHHRRRGVLRQRCHANCTLLAVSRKQRGSGR